MDSTNIINILDDNFLFYITVSCDAKKNDFCENVFLSLHILLIISCVYLLYELCFSLYVFIPRWNVLKALSSRDRQIAIVPPLDRWSCTRLVFM